MCIYIYVYNEPPAQKVNIDYWGCTKGTSTDVTSLLLIPRPKDEGH